MHRDLADAHKSELTFLGRQVYELLNLEELTIPSVQSIEVLDDERFANLEAFGEPFREGDSIALRVFLALQLENTESRKFNERTTQSEKLLGRTVWRDAQ